MSETKSSQEVNYYGDIKNTLFNKGKEVPVPGRKYILVSSHVSECLRGKKTENEIYVCGENGRTTWNFDHFIMVYS